MDHCAKEWDFDGAKTFRESLIYTRNKLSVAKSLKNPNHEKIVDSLDILERLRNFHLQKFTGESFMNEATHLRIAEIMKKRQKEQIEELINEIELLKSHPTTFQHDNDKILDLLDELKSSNISEIEISLGKRHGLLRIYSDNNDLVMQMSSH